MAGNDEFVSALEQGDMASPRYRAQLAKQQELENVFPETWGLGALGRTVADTGARVARGLRGVISPSADTMAGHVVSPRMDELLHAIKGPAADTSGVATKMTQAQNRVLAPKLTPEQMNEWRATFKTGAPEPDFVAGLRATTSTIGSSLGKPYEYHYFGAKPLASERILNAIEPIMQAGDSTRKYVDAPLAVAQLAGSRSQGSGANGLRPIRDSAGAPAEYMPAPEAPSPKWNWQQEQQFRKDMTSHPWYSEFQKKFGEAPNLNDPGYNYRAAYAAGLRPERYAPDDNAYHWPSATPSGQSLKARNHPTGWMEDYMQITGGKDPHEGYQLTPAQAETLGKSLRYRYGGQ